MNENELDRLVKKLLKEKNALGEEKPVDQSIFDTGCSFHEGGLRCAVDVKNSDGSFMSPTSPTIACFAFASELYIKAMLNKEAGIRGHELDALFGKLAPVVQDRVFSRYSDLLTGRSRPLFLKDLSDFSNAFVEWRYIHEKDGIAIWLHRLVALAWSLHASIREFRPNWMVAPDLSKHLTIKPDLSHLRVISFGGGRYARVMQSRRMG